MRAGGGRKRKRSAAEGGRQPALFALLSHSKILPPSIPFPPLPSSLLFPPSLLRWQIYGVDLDGGNFSGAEEREEGRASPSSRPLFPRPSKPRRPSDAL